MADTTPSMNAPTRWLKRLGVAGFLFFFIKGMLWLIIPAILYLSAK